MPAQTHPLIIYCVAFFAVVFCYFATPSQVFANLIFQDNFDDGTLEDWTVVRNLQWGNESAPCMIFNQPTSWQILLQKLGIIIDGPGCFTEIIPSNLILPLNTSFRYTFDITMPESSAMDRNYTLRYIDGQNTMAIKFYGNNVFLEKLVNGVGRTVPGSFSFFPFEPDHTYHVVNEILADHTVRVFVNNTLVLNFIDAEPYLDGGTPGFRAGVGASMRSVTWFDNVQIETIDDHFSLPVPYYSQTDMRWANNEYDHATSWTTNPQMKLWGCAVTSAAMLLRFHGIDSLPNGVEITPQSLNNWLKQQVDGYVGQGALNWVALGRITKQYHQLHPETASLEYKRGNIDLRELNSLAKQNQPPILELPGHFVVQSGVTSQGKAEIKDPYNMTRNEVSSDEIIGSRLFTPSFTDLSYIVIPVPENTQIWVEANGNVYYPFSTMIQNPDEHMPIESVTTQLLEIPKPPNANYMIHFTNLDGESNKIQAFIYSTEGEVMQLNKQSMPGSEEQQFILSYKNEVDGSTLQRKVTSDTFIHDLVYFRQHNEIFRTYPYDQLNKISERFMQTMVPNEQKKYQNILKYLLNLHKKYMSQTAHETLLEDVEKISD